MDVTILGTANPCPGLERAGTCIHLGIGGDSLLIDCGPWATYRMVEYDVNFAAIEDLFFTHHHADHNASFVHFVTASWYFGRQDLRIYGPKGTNDLVDGYLMAYERHIEDIAEWRDQSTTGLTDFDVRDVTPGFEHTDGDWTVEAMPTEHAYSSMDVFAYRFTETDTGQTFVFSGDTRPLDSMVEFAQGVDVLVHECNVTGDTETPLSPEDVHERYGNAPFADYFDWVFGESTQEELTDQLHTSPAEAGRIAEAADVDKLVLTHLNPRRNPMDIKREAEAEFGGTIVVAEDGMNISL